MSNASNVPLEITHHVRDHCLCLAAHRAARALARRFDEAFRPLGLTHGQFSLLMSLNRPKPPSISSVASLLAMDRTTLTANLKPLERRKLVKILIDPDDRRGRLLMLTKAGQKLLQQAVPIWKETHAQVDNALPQGDTKNLRAALRALA